MPLSNQNKGLSEFLRSQVGAILASHRARRPRDALVWRRRRLRFNDIIWRKNICARKMGLIVKI